MARVSEAWRWLTKERWPESPDIVIMQPLYIPPDLGLKGRLVVYALLLAVAAALYFWPV